MASSSFPRPGHNGGAITNYEHELLTKKATPDGVHGWVTDPMPVFAETTAVRILKVRAGVFAHVRGSLYQSGPTDVALPQLTSNTSGSPRIDTVVLRLDRADYQVYPFVIPGTPAANPVAPALVLNTGSTGFYDLPLVNVRVNHGATNLATDTVTRRCWYIGSDGQIRCTVDTRPPPEAARVAWEHPPGRYLVSTGDKWLVGVEDASAAIAASSGFSHAGGRVRRRNGSVTLTLTCWRPNGPLNANTEYKVGVVPAGYWPLDPGVASTAICPSNQSLLTYSVDEAGVILVNPGATAVPTGRAVVLSAVTYPAA